MRRPSVPLLLASFLLPLASCDGCGKAAKACARTSAPASGAPLAGDGNGDGVVDVADGVFLNRFTTAGGAAPPCTAAVDLVPDTSIDHGDAFAIWGWLFTGTTVLPGVASDACAAAEPLPDAECGRLGLSIDVADPKVKGPPGAAVTFPATVELSSPDLRVDGWSISVKADGCTVTAATTSGTSAAESVDEPQGKRSLGYDRSDATADGATSAVALSWLDDVALEPSDATAVLSLTISATPPSSGCGTCTLTLEDGVRGPGQPVVNTISVDGRSYAPSLGTAEVRVCAD